RPRGHAATPRTHGQRHRRHDRTGACGGFADVLHRAGRIGRQLRLQPSDATGTIDMAAQSGKDMLLKLDQTGSGSFLTVAGLRTRALAFNAAAIDITDAESAGRWRELLSGGGIKRASVSGSGIFKDQTSDARIRELFFAGTIRDW